MQALSRTLNRLLVLLLIFINGYCLINILTNGSYCRHFRFNGSDSLSFYLFRASPIEMIERGMYVSLSHPYSCQDLFKQIVGLAGDQISIRNERIYIGGKDYGYIHQTSPSGLTLSAIADGTIPEGFVFVHASHPQSFDSRYAEFGLVARKQLKERLWPLF